MSVCSLGVQVYFYAQKALLEQNVEQSVLSAVLSDVPEQHVSFLCAANGRFRRSTDLFYVN